MAGYINGYYYSFDGTMFKTLREKEMYEKMHEDKMYKKDEYMKECNRWDDFPDNFYNPHPKEQPYDEKPIYDPPIKSELQKAKDQAEHLAQELHHANHDLQRAVVANECLKKELAAVNKLLVGRGAEIEAMGKRIEAMQDFSRFDAMILEEE